MLSIICGSTVLIREPASATNGDLFYLEFLINKCEGFEFFPFRVSIKFRINKEHRNITLFAFDSADDVENSCIIGKKERNVGETKIRRTRGTRRYIQSVLHLV